MLFALLTIIGWILHATMVATAAAQSLSPTSEFELEQTRSALEHVIAEDSEEAVNARKTLEPLTQPGDSGRQLRNRIAERSGRRIVNGLPATGYPAVGALLLGQNPGTARAWCTGTLVGCDKFLTAAHCVAKQDNPALYWVFFPELGFFQVRHVVWPREAYKEPYANYDLAMLTLARPADGIAPMPINMSAKAKPLNNSIATIVGFGRTGGSKQDYGIRRIGSVRTGPCTSQYAQQNALCWQFDADVRGRRARANTCNGDSGGGVFLIDNDGQRRVQKVFGVVSGGTDANCVKDDESYNVDVAQFGQWIEQAGEGRLSSRLCGPTAIATEPLRSVIRLTDAKPRAVLTLEVVQDTTKLHIAMNGEDDGSGRNDFDLYVYRGKNLSSRPVCIQAQPGQFAFCAIDQPRPGPWSIVVERRQGSGEAQITAATFGRSAR